MNQVSLNVLFHKQRFFEFQNTNQTNWSRMWPRGLDWVTFQFLFFNWNGPIFENRQAKVFRDIDSGGGDFIGPNRLQQLLAPKMVRFRKEVVLDQRYSSTLKSNCSCCHDGTMTLVLMSISMRCNEDMILLRNLTNLPFQHGYELVSGNFPTQIIHTDE